MNVFPPCMSVYRMCDLGTQKSIESVTLTGTGGINVCELLCGCWKMNAGPLQEQEVLLTAKSSSNLPTSILE